MGASSETGVLFPLSDDITGLLCEYATNLHYKGIPTSALAMARMLLLDFVAAAHAGKRVNVGFNDAFLKLVECSYGPGKASVFFKRDGLSPLGAAMVNSSLAHGADMDDGNKMAAGHVGVHVVPALMALAQERKLSNAAFFEAMVVGYDVFCRLAASCMPHMVNRGFHSTGTAGALAVALAASKLLGLTRDGMYHALAIAASQSAGLLLVGETGQEVKPLNAAKAAEAGMLAALLAEQGVVGPRRPLESAKGWYHAMTPEVDVSLALDKLGERFFIEECYLKSYPSCRHTHSAIDAALRLRDCAITSPDDIRWVRVFTYAHAIDLAGMTAHPRTPGEAKFSIQYAVAKALVEGHFNLVDLDISATDQAVFQLAERIELVEDNGFEAPSEGIRGARVIVQLEGAADCMEETVLVPKGDPENPFTLDDMKRKLRDCCLNKDGSELSEIDAIEYMDSELASWEESERIFAFPRNERWEVLS